MDDEKNIIKEMKKKEYITITCGMKYMKYGRYARLCKPNLNPEHKKWIVYDDYADGKLIYRSDNFEEAFTELLKPWDKEKKCDFTKN